MTESPSISGTSLALISLLLAAVASGCMHPTPAPDRLPFAVEGRAQGDVNATVELWQDGERSYAWSGTLGRFQQILPDVPPGAYQVRAYQDGLPCTGPRLEPYGEIDDDQFYWHLEFFGNQTCGLGPLAYLDP